VALLTRSKVVYLVIEKSYLKEVDAMSIFGPVPSRRLGSSLGINNIPYKVCSYTCVYCQIGRTLQMDIQRRRHSEPRELADLVKKKLQRLKETGGKVDYLTLVPDGEPTLDLSLGELLPKLKETGVPVAVISNASLIWRSDVREELAIADWVSLKIDAFTPEVWKQVDRPYPSLDHEEILAGMEEFSRSYRGTLCTETMLVKDLNDGPMELEGIARFISSKLRVHKAYISVPTRPPAASWVQMPDAKAIAAAYVVFEEKGIPVETLTGYEGNAFVITDDPAEEILNITAVHPMRSDAVEEVLQRKGADEETVQHLVEEGRIRKVHYDGWTYYIRIMEETQDVEVSS
jgi:wyosine [tRNA(Phe)-imidazoG37] synthetase (radical SAM superfamily)